MHKELLLYREQFPALKNCTHLVSHSLGAMPEKAIEYVGEFMSMWRQDSIEAWSEWLPEVDRAGARIAKMLSAPQDSVIMHTNCSTAMSVVASCFEYPPERNKIVYSALQFPTISYVWHEETRRGASIHIVESDDGITIDTQKMIEAIDESTAVVPISHVIFSSAYIQDAKAICRRAAEVGAHVVLDCYQSLGTIPVDIVDIGASFACGGSVKYMCGGPGAAYLYVRPDLHQKFRPRVTGWLGHQAPFAFTMPEQQYADNVWRYMGGTPAVIALFQARAGAEIVAEIGARKIRERSLSLTQRVIDSAQERDFKLNTPLESERRGGSVVFDFSGAADVARELNRRKYFCDHRPGVGVRVGPHFYTTEDEIDAFFAELDQIRGVRD